MMKRDFTVIALLFVLFGSTILQNASAQEDELLVYVDNIRSLLEESKVQYAAGNTEEAQRLAMEAYIDNYEYLEDPVGAQNEELNEDLEIMLRHELQNLIVQEAPVEEVHTKIDEILEKMDVVAVIVPEFGSLALIVLVISLVSILVIGLRNNNLRFFPN